MSNCIYVPYFKLTCKDHIDQNYVKCFRQFDAGA